MADGLFMLGFYVTYVAGSILLVSGVIFGSLFQAVQMNKKFRDTVFFED